MREDGHSTSVGCVKCQNFSNVNLIHKNVHTLQNLTLAVTQSVSYYINKLKGTVDNFLQSRVPQISQVCQLYCFSSGDSGITLKLELYTFDLNFLVYHYEQLVWHMSGPFEHRRRAVLHDEDLFLGIPLEFRLKENTKKSLGFTHQLFWQQSMI